MRLVVGPTNSGKSTWIERNHQDAVFAYELQRGHIPASDAVLHYNLLLLAPKRFRSGAPLITWNLLEDEVLKGCLARGEIDKATVIVAPIDDLLDRATARTEIEETRPGTPAYPADMWHSILEQVDLFSLYQQLFDVLDAHNIAYDVLFNANGTDEMPQTDRCFVHAALRGRHVPLPPQEDIDAVLGFPGVEYQEVLLPRQMTTSHQRFSHTNGSRRQTFDQIADTPLRDRSVLDIGCAMGDMLFWYERFGATQLTGIDLRQSRLDAAKRIGELLHSDARFFCGDFLKSDEIGPHDDVLVLNVLHHIADFSSFLAKAVELTRERLIIEFPTLQDKKFRRLGDIPEGLDHLPLIGVSSRKVDQTFVFTRAALQRLIDDLGDFEMETRQSPFANREIAIFTRR